MAIQAGIIPGLEAKKLYSYPTLSGDQYQLLTGSGTWVVPTFTTESCVGGVKLMWGTNMLGSIAAANFEHTYSFVTDSDGNLVYSNENGTPTFTVPAATGE